MRGGMSIVAHFGTSVIFGASLVCEADTRMS
jgi:hypothetical protein